jgi:hypothetical protein
MNLLQGQSLQQLLGGELDSIVSLEFMRLGNPFKVLARRHAATVLSPNVVIDPTTTLLTTAKTVEWESSQGLVPKGRVQTEVER